MADELETQDDEMAESDDSIRLREIEEVGREVEAAWDTLQHCKAEHSHASKVYGERVIEMRETIAKHSRRLPLFEGAVEPATEVRDWESVVLSTLPGITGQEGIIMALGDEGIATMGELATYGQSHVVDDIDGIGPERATIIEQATKAFWKANPDAGTDKEED